MNALVQPGHRDVAGDQVGREAGAIAEVLLQDGGRGKSGRGVTRWEGKPRRLRAVVLDRPLAPDRLLDPDHKGAGQQLPLDFVHAEMLQAAVLLATADGVGDAAGAEQHGGVADVLARREERVGPLEVLVDLLVVGMHRRRGGAAGGQPVHGVHAREVLDVVNQVVAQRRDEAAGRLGARLADRGRGLLSGILRLRRGVLCERAGR